MLICIAPAVFGVHTVVGDHEVDGETGSTKSTRLTF